MMFQQESTKLHRHREFGFIVNIPVLNMKDTHESYQIEIFASFTEEEAFHSVFFGFGDDIM